MQILGKLVALNGKKLESQNKFHDTLQYYLWGIQFGKDIDQKDQSIISYMISGAVIAINTHPIIKLVAQDKLAEPDYQQIIQELPKIEMEHAPYNDILEREYRYVYLRNYQWLGTPYKAAKDVVDFPGVQFQQQPNTRLDKIKHAIDVGLYTGYIFLNRNQITRNQLDYSTEMLAAETTKSYKEFMSVDWESKRPNDWVDQRIYGYLRIHDSHYVSGIISHYPREKVIFSYLRIAQIQAAIYLYHLKNKKWPNSLQDLEPGYISKVPLDPFIDQPFHWSKDSAGPFVYSVGPDFKDDSAKILYNPTNGTVSDGNIRP